MTVHYHCGYDFVSSPIIRESTIDPRIQPKTRHQTVEKETQFFYFFPLPILERAIQGNTSDNDEADIWV